MSEWRDISTAPKDGTYVLVWHNHDAAEFWTEEGGQSVYHQEVDIFGRVQSDKCHAIAAWIDDGAGPAWWTTLEGDMPVVNPTHWMPLPTPPEADQ